jgi:hypothetical protein
VRALLLLVAGCGRLDFCSAPGTSPGDAQLDGTFDPSELVDLTAAAPIISAPLSTSGQCGQYLIGLSIRQVDGQIWRPSLLDLGATAELVMPCKYANSGNPGWAVGLAYLDESTVPPTATWYDANGPMNEMVNAHALASDGLLLQSFGVLGMASDGARLFGFAGSIHDGTTWHILPVQVDQMEHLLATDLAIGMPDVFQQNLGDGTWRAASTWQQTILYRDGAFQLFSEQYDYPNSPSTYYIAVNQSTNGTDVTFPPAPLLTAYSHPVVTQLPDRVFLFAIDEVASRWVMFDAPSIAELSTATPVPLDLGRFHGTGWNQDNFVYVGVEPLLIGARAHDGVIDLYYWAGAGEYTAATAPYMAARAIGVLRASLH